MMNQSSGTLGTSNLQSVITGPSSSNIVGSELSSGAFNSEENSTSIRIGLTVNLLADQGLVDWEYQNSIPTAILSLSNEQLGDKDSIFRAISAVDSAEERAILTDAFEYLEDDSEMYNVYWKPGVSKEERSGNNIIGPLDEVNFILEDLLEQTGLKTSDYFSLLRDRNVARNLLLEKQTLQYRLIIKPNGDMASPFDGNILITTSEKVQWDIKVYRVVQVCKPEIIYYRFAIRAVAKPHDVLVPAISLRSSKMFASAYLQKDSGQEIPISVDKEITNPVNSNLQRLDVDIVNKWSVENVKDLTFSSNSESGIDLAGVISGDLSQALESDRKSGETMTVGNPSQGGIGGELANFTAQDQMLALVSFEVPAELEDSVAIEFTRTHTDLGYQKASNPDSVLDNAQFAVSPEGQHLRFLPKGCYEGQLNAAALNSLENYKLVLNDSSPSLNEEGRFMYYVDRDALQKMKMQLVPK